MSLPQLPLAGTYSREDVINQIISSIASEELGLSHIINSEGEKLQYALGTIQGVTGPAEPTSISQLLEINESIRRTLDSATTNQLLLKDKLYYALNASMMTGPAGPTGPQGPASIQLDSTVDKLEPEAQPTVENTGTPEEMMLKFGIPRGATGADGSIGATGPTGAAQALGVQAIFSNTGGAATEIQPTARVPFNQSSDDQNPDISLDSTTGILTINRSGLNNIYLINWWLFVDGTADDDPVTFSLNVGTEQHQVTAPWPDMQISGSALTAVGNDPVEVSITNTHDSAVGITAVAIPAQIIIIGFTRTA